MDTVLSLVIVLYFATMMASYSILGFHPVEFMHSFKFWLKLIYLTFGYVRGCALGRNLWMASALDVVHPEGKGKGNSKNHLFDPMKCISQICPYKTTCRVGQFCSTCDTVGYVPNLNCTCLRLPVLNWLVHVSSSSCMGIFGLLHFMGLNKWFLLF